MSTKSELLPIERSLWTDGPEAYRRNVDERCLVAFTEMAGVSSRDEIAATVTDGPRWRDLEIEVEGLVEPAPDVAVITYEARAVQGEDGDERRYHALVSSGYVRREDGWKLVFHQQTPLE